MGQFRWAGQSAGWPQEGPWPGLKITPVSSAGSTVSLSWPYFNGLPTGGFFELDWELSSYGYKVGDTFNALATNYADDLQTKIVAQSTFLCTIDPL